jgi:hypothetical protein
LLNLLSFRKDTPGVKLDDNLWRLILSFSGKTEWHSKVCYLGDVDQHIFNVPEGKLPGILEYRPVCISFSRICLELLKAISFIDMHPERTEKLANALLAHPHSLKKLNISYSSNESSERLCSIIANKCLKVKNMTLRGIHGKTLLHKLGASLSHLDTFELNAPDNWHWGLMNDDDAFLGDTFLGLRSFSNLQELKLGYISSNICPFKPATDWTRLTILKGFNILSHETWRTAISELPYLQTIKECSCDSEISMCDFFHRCVGKAIAGSLHEINIKFYEGSEDYKGPERNANIEEGVRLLFDTFANATSIKIKNTSFAFQDIETAKALGRLQHLHTIYITHNNMSYVGELAPSETWAATMIPHFPKTLVDVYLSIRANG